jgi:protein-serine/threonine kinase
VINSHGHTSAVDWWTLGILIFEMIFATTPFKGVNRSATFANVMSLDVAYPDTAKITQQGKDIIVRLLHKDERRRLGSQSGASEVKAHKWFAKINWGLLRNTRPPIVPEKSNGVDAVNFRNMRESSSLDLDAQITGVAGSGVGSVPPTPGLGPDDGMEDLFGAFSSVTLEYDGDP